MPVTIKCIICGLENKVSPSQSDKKYCGRSCYAKDMKRVATTRKGRTSRKTHEQFLLEVDEFLNKEYVVTGVYVNNRTKVSAVHITCGEEVLLSPKDMLRGIGCFSCGKKRAGLSGRLSSEEFSQRFEDTIGSKYQQLTPYETSQEKIEVRHKVCGFKFLATPNNLITKLSGCPNCKQSKGEEKVSIILSNLNVPYLREYKFQDCEYVNKLRFDFAITKKGSVVLLIEFDGIQHFEPIEQFGGECGHRLTIERDRIKDDYCRENNIHLLRIPYTLSDTEIESQVEKALIKCFFNLSDTQIPSQPEMETSGSV